MCMMYIRTRAGIGGWKDPQDKADDGWWSVALGMRWLWPRCSQMLRTLSVALRATPPLPHFPDHGNNHKQLPRRDDARAK